MKKHFYLTLLLALFSAVTAWAQFAPVAGKMYALRETTTGLYLDIQKLGKKDPNAGVTTNNLSLNIKPCIIYFAAGTTDNTKWTMQNVNGTYAMQATNLDWNATIGTTAYEWTINEPETSIYTIARADGKYIQADTKENGEPLYCDKKTGMQFTLVEYSDLCEQFTYTLKSDKADNYLSLTTVSSTVASFQATATEFYIKTSAGEYIFLEDKANEGTYIGSTHTWNATTDFSLWTMGKADENGYVYLTRFDDSNQHLGNTLVSDAGTGVYTNVPLSDSNGNCNKWLIEGTMNCPTAAEDQDGKKHFTSGSFAYEGVYNKLRFTLTESAAFYKNGAKRLSFDSFVLYKADGTAVELKADYFTGNNITDFSGMIDETDGTYSNATWDLSSATDDWFEILLPAGIDLGGAFSFSFVTENTTMNPSAFRVDISYEKSDYIFKIDAPQDVTITYNGSAIADGEDITADYDEALFDIEEIDGYATKFVVDKEANTLTLVYEKAYSLSLVDAPDGAALTYNGNAITDGSYVGITYDTQYLSVTCPNGYIWEVTTDNVNRIFTVTFTQLQSEENPAAVVELINRIGGDGTDAKFKFVLDPSLNYDQETFVIGSEDGKVLIKGTTISAITTGIGWYLQNIAHINIAWNSLNEKTVSGDAYADLSSIPVPTAEETHTSDAMYRYYLNTCVFGYSMTTWTWKRWQQEIDWMALHGVNMPLQLVGLEEVWRSFLTLEDENGVRKYNYTDAQAKAFVPGPAFIAWWAMNNLQGWGGTAKASDVNADNGNNGWDGSGGVQDDAWYARQKKLAQLILARQRELGMQPVLPGWSGMVPANFASISGYATRANGGWNGGFKRPLLLNVSNSNYAEIAADYYACLKEVMGESQYYSMDPFHEGGGAGTMEDYTAMYEAMEQAKPGSQWVIQQWQWSATQKYSLTAVPAGRLIVLDLFADGSPAFDSYSGFAPQDAVFSIIPNFGGRSGLMGRLTNLTDNYFSYKAKYSTIKGIGAAPEAIEQTPVTYDLLFQLAWMDSKPDVAEWVSNYAISRYGVVNAELQEAWSLLRQGPLNYGADAIQGPVEDVWAAVPNLSAKPASTWGKTLNTAGGTYTKARRQMLIDATYKLLSQKDAVSGDIYLSNYNYDLVEFGGGVLADYAYDLLLGISAAKTAAGDAFENDATYIARRNAFLALIEDVDEFKGTNLNFRLGKWTQEARDAAAEVKGATTATADWYEYNNARTIISTWSSPDATSLSSPDLNDYSYRSWQGMMKDYYLPRWKHFFENGCTQVEYDYFEWNWAHGMEHYVGQTAISSTPLTSVDAGYTGSYTREPEGNTVEVATKVLGKYIIPIKADNGAYYAYRYLTETNNAFTDAVISVAEGATVDLNDYFGDLTSGGTKTVTITCDAFSDASNFAAVVVNSGIAGNSYTATIAISDGTALQVTVKVVTAEFFAAKDTLATLIEQMESLTAQVGTYITETEIEMQATTEGDDYYIWCSNPHPKNSDNKDGDGGVAALLDNNNSTYLHSNWSTVSTSNDFLQVELGTGNELKKFKIAGVQRADAATDFPESIEVLGSTDGNSWTTITTVSGIPTNASASWTSDVIVPTADYPYLRFVVTTNKNRIYFHMAEFNLYDVTTTADVFDMYDGTALTPEYAAAKYDALLSAMDVYENATTVDELTTATTELQQAYNDLMDMIDAINEPVTGLVDGAVYRIYGRLSDGTLRTLYTNGAGNRILWAEYETRTDAATLFVAQQNGDTWKLVSALADGIWSHDATLTEDGVELTLSAGEADGTFKIVDNTNRSFVVDSEDLDFYSTGIANVNTTVTTDFIFKKVRDISPVSYTLTMSRGNKFATLYLPYAVEVPADVEAYVAQMPDAGTGATEITLTDALSVVPAYTPVIVYREEALAASVGDYIFGYENETAPDEVAVTNALVGKLQETYVKGKLNYQYYTLLTIDEHEAFYWIYKEYDADKNLYPGEDKTHIKCAPNKAYMELPTSGNPAATYSFRFPGTTAVDEIVTEVAEDGAIYDLQGRKLQVAPEKGVYIVNGKLVIK